MNDRIKKLLVQCTHPSLDGEFATSYVDQEKFAELIVRECLDILDDEDDGEIEGRSIRIARIRIKEQFGIKE